MYVSAVLNDRATCKQELIDVAVDEPVMISEHHSRIERQNTHKLRARLQHGETTKHRYSDSTTAPQKHDQCTASKMTAGGYA